jgi:hypothetical protein
MSDRDIMEWVLRSEYIPAHYGNSRELVRGYFLVDLSTKTIKMGQSENKKRKLLSFETSNGLAVYSYNSSSVNITLNYILGYSLCPLIDMKIMKKLISFSNIPLPKILDVLLKFNRENKIYCHMILNMLGNYNGWLNRIDLDMYVLNLRKEDDMLIYIRLCLMDIKKVCSFNHIEEISIHDCGQDIKSQSNPIPYELVPFGKVDEVGDIQSVAFPNSYVGRRTNVLGEDFILNGITRYYKNERYHCSFMYLNQNLYLYIKNGGPLSTPLPKEKLELGRYIIMKFCSHFMIRKFPMGCVEYENIARVFIKSFDVLCSEHFIPI